MNSVKRYDGNCFWKDNVENVPSLSLFESIKNEMTDWEVKLEYISFDEIQITSKDTPAQYILVDNERGYVLNGEVVLANQVRVFKYNLDYISTFFLPFITNLKTESLYMYALRAPFFDAKTVIQNDDEKIRAINKTGRYIYGKNYYYKENTTYSGQNVVRCYDDYTKADSQNYIEYSSNDNIVNGCLYFVFADGDNGKYRFIPVLAKTGTVVYSKNEAASTTEPTHTYNLTINGNNPLTIMPNYQDFIDANYFYTDGNCRSYRVIKEYVFSDVRLTDGTSPTTKFPNTLSGTTLRNLLDEYAGIAYLSFPNYGGEDNSNTDYIRICNTGNTFSTDKHYIDANVFNNSNIKVYWSMVKNSAGDNHYYNYFDNNISKTNYNRLMLRTNATYQTYAVNNYAVNLGNACDFSFTGNTSYVMSETSMITNYSIYSSSISPSALPLKISNKNNIYAMGTNLIPSNNLCYKYILVSPYSLEVNLQKYTQSSTTYLHNEFYSYRGSDFEESATTWYHPFFPKTPTCYFVNNSDTYNSTTANYTNFGNAYITKRWGNYTGTGTVNGNTIKLDNTPNSSYPKFMFQRYLKTLQQSKNTTSIKITFPQKTTVNQNRYTINNSWNTLYQYATTYNNGNGDAAQFLGIYMLPHMFAFPNAVKQIRTRGSYQFLELDLPSDGVDIKPFKFINGTNFNFSNPTPAKILHPNDTNIKSSWWYFSKYADVFYMNNELHPEYYYQQYNSMQTDGWFCFNGTGTYIDKLDILSLKACIWTLPNQLPSFTNTYASYIQSTINSANTSYQVAKNNMVAGVLGGLTNIAASAAMGAFSMSMGGVLAGALGEIGGVVGGIGRTAENAAMASGGASPLTNFVTGNKIKLSKMMGYSQMTTGALKNSGGLISSIIGFKNRQMEIKAHYADAKNKMQNKLNPSTSDDIALLEQWVGENSQYNVVEYFFPDEVTYKQWNSVLYYYSFKTNKNEYSHILFNENNWNMFNDCVYFVFDDELMKSAIQSYKPFNDLYSNVKQFIYELLTNGFRIWMRKPEECLH